MNLTKHYQDAWDKKVDEGFRYTQPVSSETIEKSKVGKWEISVTTGNQFQEIGFPKN